MRAPAAPHPGTMIDPRSGVMAADQTEELRARRIGEVVDHAERLLERRFGAIQRTRWQALWSQSLAAQSGVAPVLTDTEAAELAHLSADELWSRAIESEQKARVAALRAASDAETLTAFKAREGWP